MFDWLIVATVNHSMRNVIWNCWPGPDQEEVEDLTPYGALSARVQSRLANTESLQGYGALAPLQDRRPDSISVQPFNLVRFSPGIQSQATLLTDLKPYGALAGPKPVNY